MVRKGAVKKHGLPTRPDYKRQKRVLRHLVARPAQLLCRPHRVQPRVRLRQTFPKLMRVGLRKRVPSDKAKRALQHAGQTWRPVVGQKATPHIVPTRAAAVHRQHCTAARKKRYRKGLYRAQLALRGKQQVCRTFQPDTRLMSQHSKRRVGQHKLFPVLRLARAMPRQKHRTPFHLRDEQHKRRRGYYMRQRQVCRTPLHRRRVQLKRAMRVRHRLWHARNPVRQPPKGGNGRQGKLLKPKPSQQM